MARPKRVFYLVCTHVHVCVDSASGRLPAAQAEGREPALYSGLGHVHTRSPDTRPCVTHAIQTNACDDERKLEQAAPRTGLELKKERHVRNKGQCEKKEWGLRCRGQTPPEPWVGRRLGRGGDGQDDLGA